jgi:hypothetical protein
MRAVDSRPRPRNDEEIRTKWVGDGGSEKLTIW